MSTWNRSKRLKDFFSLPEPEPIMIVARNRQEFELAQSILADAGLDSVRLDLDEGPPPPDRWTASWLGDLYDLTVREQQVLEMMLAGYGDLEIALRVRMTPSRLKVCIDCILEKAESECIEELLSLIQQKGEEQCH